MKILKITGPVFSLWLFFNASASAQNTEISSSKSMDIKKWYIMNASEMIFSGGKIETSQAIAGINQLGSSENVVRFSAFFHFQQQMHFNFNKNLGIYTGLGIRNVGFINTFSGLEKKIRVKQRSYSLGVPLAIKAGDLNGYYFVAGAEAELMFAYKRKVFYDGDKSKKSQWFSDDINLFNPGIFAEVHFKGGSYVRAKYYLMDFLKNETETFVLPDDGRIVSYQVDSSKLFYISIGTSIKAKKTKARNTSSTPTNI